MIVFNGSIKRDVDETIGRAWVDFTFDDSGQTIHGEAGTRCWWMPISETGGIKIYKCRTYGNLSLAERLTSYQRDKWLSFYGTRTELHKYLPEVYGFTVFQHKQKDKKTYYICAVMRRYNNVLRQPPAEMATIKELFRESGCALSKGTFAGHNSYNFARDGDNVILLDIELAIRKIRSLKAKIL